MWQMAIPAAINLAGGLFGSRSAKKAGQQQMAARQNQAAAYTQAGQDVSNAYGTYGQDMFGLAGQARDVYKFTPYSVRSPFGTASMENGQFSTNLGPEGQMLMGMAGNTLNEASQYDRMGAQDAYFQNLQRLASTARGDQMSAAKRMLFGRGQMGLGGNVNGNMMMRGLASGWADQDAQMAKMSMDYGGQELDRLLGRGYGMLGQAAGLSNNMANQWQMVQGAAQPYEMAGRGGYMNLMQQGFNAPLQGMLAQAGYNTNAANILAGGQIEYAAQRDAANQGMIRGFTNAASSLPWGSMFSGGGNMPANMFSQSSGNVDAMLRAGMGVGPW